jgi:hypothetical protein
MSAAAARTVRAEVTELAARHQLGDLQAEFAPKRLSKAIFALYVFLLVHLLALLVLPGLVFYWWLRRTPNFSGRQAAKRLYLFEHGMIVHPQSGPGTVVARWDSVRLHQEVTQLYINGLPAPTKYLFSVAAPDGVHVTITEFYEGPDSWGPWMQEAIVRAQHLPMTQEILAGRTVDFGALRVSEAGLTGTAEGRLAWSEVGEIAVRGGRVYVTKAGLTRPWSNLAAASLVNLHLFLTLTENLLARSRAGEHRDAGA